MVKDEIQQLNELAALGFSNSEILHNANAQLFEKLNSSYYAIAMAISLVWSNHATSEKRIPPIEFISYTADYIEKGGNLDAEIINKYKGFRGDRLLSTIVSFRKFYTYIQPYVESIQFRFCTINDLYKLQQRLTRVFAQKKSFKDIPGYGAWFLYAPFKIILINEKRFWNDEELNIIIQPIGYEVVKSIAKLKRRKISVVANIDLKEISLPKEKGQIESDIPNLVNNIMNDYHLIHPLIIEIAKSAHTNALHINSALQKYAGGNIKG